VVVNFDGDGDGEVDVSWEPATGYRFGGIDPAAKDRLLEIVESTPTTPTTTTTTTTTSSHVTTR
jgi:hypothetical protein